MQPIALGVLETTPAAIAIGQTVGAAFPTAGLSLVGLMMPAAFTGTAISFQACNTLGGTFLPVTSGVAGAALSYVVAASKYVAIDPLDFAGIQFLKLVSNGAEAANRSIVCSMKGI